jgi:3-oxoadipate enol-lactonase / 4-carboxymuconolactone decarboxylase
MPFTTRDNVRLYYRLEGRAGAPPLVLAHCLGLDHGMWDEQVEALRPHFRLLTYDSRGHGASDAPAGDYTLDELGRDALAVADAAGVAEFAFCGLSLGGMVGQWLGIHARERLTHLVLASTTPRLTEPQGMETRRTTVLAEGMAPVVDLALSRCFSPDLIAAAPPRVAWARHTMERTSPIGYAGCCAVLRDLDTTKTLAGISTPTLVLAAERDVSMPWEQHAAVLARDIPGASLVRLPAAHVANIERPRTFTAALLRFLLPAEPVSLERATAVRRSVLGDAHVDRAAANATDLTRAFQELITRFAWGTIWTRPGLDHRTRRLLVLAITAALGRWEEFRLHVRTGLAHELEPADLEEALLQTAVYAGVPAANEGFRIAAEEVAKAASS